MPQWKELPNGRWVVVPSVSTYYDQLSGTKGDQFNVADYSDPNYLLRQAARLRRGEKLTPGERGLSAGDKKTLLGSLAEGVKAIPGGVLDLGVSGAEAAIGVLTPGIDLSIEKRLRKISEDRALKRDPLYRDSLAVGVGQGLGQVSGLTALTRVPGYGKLLGVASGISLGISDQTRRIAEYERRTGENIPWYKESMAHLLGGATGLLEMILPARLANTRPVSRMQKMLTRTTPIDLATTSGKLRSAVEGVAIEGIQEGLAQGLQSMTARGLYDPNALEDLGASMMEDAKVGGIVGGIADIAATMLLGPNRNKRGPHTTEEMQSVQKELLRSKHRYYSTPEGQEALSAIDNGLVADPLASIMEGTNIDRQMASDISAMFDGEWAVLPRGFEESLLQGGIEVEQIKAIRDELEKRTSLAVTTLQERGKKSKDLAEEKNYEDAVRAIVGIQSTRISALDKSLEQLGLGLRRLGGISESKEYQDYWDTEGYNTPTYQKLADIVSKRHKGPSLTKMLEGFFGGNFGRPGFKRLAEILGVHKGPGSQAVLKNIPDDETQLRPDSSLASSDAANFSIDNIGRAIFGLDGKAGQLEGIQYTDNQKLVDSTRQADNNIKELENEVDRIEKENPTFRFEAERLGLIEEDTTEQEWERIRDQNAKQILLQQGNLFEMIAQQRESRGDDYTKALLSRINYLREFFKNPKNSDAKAGAIKRLQFDTQYGDNAESQFDLWMENQEVSVAESIERSDTHRKRLKDEQARMESELSNLDPTELAQAQIKLMPAVRAAFKRNTKNVSATDFVRLTKLFNPDLQQSNDIVRQGMVIKAMADIGMWQVDNSQHVIEGGVLVLNETVPLVQEFIESDLKGRQEASTRVAKILLTKDGQPKSYKEGMSINEAYLLLKPGRNRKKLAAIVKEMGYTLEQLDRLIVEEDIKQLLRSKNIFLRGDFDGSREDATQGNIGTLLEKQLGTGVKSMPFEKLLTDMTGALSWEQASDAQRLLMYSRLLKLPSHRVQENQADTKQLYMPLYLPNFYQTKVSQEHLNTLTRLLVGTKRKPKVGGSLITKIRKETKKKLGDSFDPKIFNESLASLIETGLLTHSGERKTESLLPDGEEVGIKEDEFASTKDGDRGTPGNPRTKRIDKITRSPEGSIDIEPEPLPLSTREGDTALHTIRNGNKKAVVVGEEENLNNGEIVTLNEKAREEITPQTLQKRLQKEAPQRKTLQFKLGSTTRKGQYPAVDTGFLSDLESLETEALNPTDGTAGGTPIIDPVIGEVLMKSVEHAYNAQRVDPKKDAAGIVWYNPESQLGTGKYNGKETIDDMIRVVRTKNRNGKPINEESIRKQNKAMLDAGWLRGRRYDEGNALRRAIYTIDSIARPAKPMVEDIREKKIGQGVVTFVKDPKNSGAKLANLLGKRLYWNPKTDIKKKYTIAGVKANKKKIFVSVRAKLEQDTKRTGKAPKIQGTPEGKTRGTTWEQDSKTTRGERTSRVYYVEVGPWSDDLGLHHGKNHGDIEPDYTSLLEAKFDPRFNPKLVRRLNGYEEKLAEQITNKERKKHNATSPLSKYPPILRDTGNRLERIRFERNREMYEREDPEYLIMTKRGLIQTRDATEKEKRFADDQDPVTVEVMGIPKTLRLDVNYQKTVIPLQSQLADAEKILEGFASAKSVEMNFSDGKKYKGVTHTMLPEHEGESTISLIKQGVRSRTTRANPIKGVYKGSYIRIKNRDGPDIFAEVTSDWQKVSDVDVEQWTRQEGWDQATYNQLKNQYTITYNVLGKNSELLGGMTSDQIRNHGLGYIMGQKIIGQTGTGFSPDLEITPETVHNHVAFDESTGPGQLADMDYGVNPIFVALPTKGPPLVNKNGVLQNNYSVIERLITNAIQVSSYGPKYADNYLKNLPSFVLDSSGSERTKKSLEEWLTAAGYRRMTDFKDIKDFTIMGGSKHFHGTDYIEGTSDVWIPIPDAVKFAIQTGHSAANYEYRVRVRDKLVQVQPYNPHKESNYVKWAEQAKLVSDMRNQFRQTAILPYTETVDPKTWDDWGQDGELVEDQLMRDPTYLAPWYESINNGTYYPWGTPDNILEEWSRIVASQKSNPSYISDIFEQLTSEQKLSAPTSTDWVSVLRQLGLTKVPWNVNNLIVDDKNLPTEKEITPDQLARYRKKVRRMFKSNFNIADEIEIEKKHVIEQIKYEKLFERIFAGTKIPVFMVGRFPSSPGVNFQEKTVQNPDGSRSIQKPFILIDRSWLQENIIDAEPDKDGNLPFTHHEPGTITPGSYEFGWSLSPVDLKALYKNVDDFVVHVVAHEKAHSKLPREEVGSIASEMNPSPMSLSAYENIINNLAQTEQSRLAFDQVQQEMARKQKEELESTPPKFEKDTVGVRMDYQGPGFDEKYMTDFFTDQDAIPTEEQTIAPPYSERRIEIDKEIYFYYAKPKQVQKIMNDKNLSGSVQTLLDNYNKNNPKDKLSLRQYIERFASHITSEFGLQELAELGVVEGVATRLRKASELVQADTFLQVNTPEGSKVITALIGQGAIPSSLKKRSMIVRREFINTLRTRFEVLESVLNTRLKALKIPDNITKVFVDNADGIFQGLAEVGLRGEMFPETEVAVYDSASNRIIINLAAIDADSMASAQKIIGDAALHESVHTLIRRDHLYDSELDVLLDYAKGNVVSKEWDPRAHEMGVTWFEKLVYDLKDTNLNEADIEEEAMTELMVALTQNKVPDALINGRMRKTKRFLGGIFEGIVGSARDAEIVELLQVLANVESGRAGQRGSGYQGDTEFTEGDEIRSTRLLRYADPSQVDELVKAIALRDAAKSDSMVAQEQAKIDAITDKVVQQRTEIQESAGVVSEIDAITNIKEGVKEVQNENSYAIPLLNGEIWSSSDNLEARRLALDEFLKSRRKETNYTMPREYMNMFNQQHKVTKETKSLVDELVADGAITGVDGDSFRKSLETGVLSGDQLGGEDPSETLDHLEKSTVSNMRYQFLDRRQWTVEQTDRILAAQDRAMLDAQTSALVMWRNADNTVNWLGGMLKQGPLSYLGYSTGSGEFDISPSYDEQLAKKYDSTGRVKGLLEIFSFISQPIDEQVASAYGIAKRIEWTRNRRDEITRLLRPDPMRSNLLMKYEDPELRGQKEMFDRAYERINPKDEKTNKRVWSDQAIEKIITKVESNEPHIVEFWDNYQAYNRAMIQMAYSTSLITRGQRDEWLSMPYTPFYRDTNPIESFPIGSGQQMAKRGRINVEKALKGSLEPISSDLINSIMENTQALVRDAMINVAASRTARDSVALNEGKRVTLSDLAGDVESRVIRVMEQGKAVHYQLDDAQQAMAVMMLGFNPKKRIEDLFGGMKAGEYVAKALTGSSSLLREAVTRTPPFQIKNIFRDSWQASTIVGGGPSLVINSIRNALDPDVQRRAEERGLSIGIDFVAEPGEYGNVMRKQLESANLDWTNPLAPFSALWTFLGKIAKQSEVATRVAVYDRVFAATGDRALAQYLAIEIMNYGRRGANPALSTYMSTVPFMNGRLQGTDVIIRGLRSKKGSSDVPSLTAYGMTQTEYEALPWWQQNRQQIINRGLILSSATALLYWMMYDDEEYQDLRDEVKADNWLLPLGDHAWLKLPIPFEVGVLFKVIPEQIMRAIFEEDYDLVDVGGEYKRQLRTSLSLGGPQLIGPLLGAMSNYDKYRKDFIVDPFTAKLSPNEQRNRFTSNTARTISDAVNMIPLVNNLDFLTSPMKMEYMLRQYFGTMGGYVTTVADRVARLGVLPTIPFDPLMNWSEAESIVGSTVDFDWESLIGGPGVANVPILGDLLVDPRTRAGRQQEFYELVQELDSVVATLNAISDEDRQRGFEYQQKHQELLNKQGQIRIMEKRMTAWRERREALADIPRESLSDDEKRQRYERLLDSRLGILHTMDELLLGETRARKRFRWGNK